MHYYLIVNKKTGKPKSLLGINNILFKLKSTARDYLSYYMGFNTNKYEVRKFKIEEVKWVP